MGVEQRLERMIYLADEREVSQEAEPQICLLQENTRFTSWISI